MQQLLRCPICKSKLSLSGDFYSCMGGGCSAEFPIVDGIPIIINEQNSIFTTADFTGQRNTTYNLSKRRSVKKLIANISPSISGNITSKDNYQRFISELLERTPSPKVLIVGGSVIGRDMEALVDHPAIELLETDVSFGPRTALICDGHDLPLDDNAFDGVVAQAVLEHVADPYRCTAEMHRILKPNGVVYADTPFMQHGHMGPYDFTRFTHLGHRRLFRQFEEIASGVGCGPGTGFAWAYQYFLLSFARNKLTRSIIKYFTNFTAFYFKYLDNYLNQKPGAFDAASSIYFIGSKSDTILPDRELIKQFKGLA